jgi:hypothetical protein
MAKPPELKIACGIGELQYFRENQRRARDQAFAIGAPPPRSPNPCYA